MWHAAAPAIGLELVADHGDRGQQFGIAGTCRSTAWGLSGPLRGTRKTRSNPKMTSCVFWLSAMDRLRAMGADDWAQVGACGKRVGRPADS
jgi:hypothetical protein